MSPDQAQQLAERVIDDWKIKDPTAFRLGHLKDLIAAELLAVQREAYREALNDVARDWASYEFRGHDNVTSLEVQTFLDTRHVHYPKAQAIRGETT